MRMQLERHKWVDGYSVEHEFYTPLYGGVIVTINPKTSRVFVSYETTRDMKRYRRQGGRIARIAKRAI